MGVTCLRTRLGKCWIALQNLHQKNQMTHNHVDHRAMIQESRHQLCPPFRFWVSGYNGHERLVPLKREHQPNCDNYRHFAPCGEVKGVDWEWCHHQLVEANWQIGPIRGHLRSPLLVVRERSQSTQIVETLSTNVALIIAAYNRQHLSPVTSRLRPQRAYRQMI